MDRSTVTVWICYEASRADGLVWAIRHGRRWLNAAHVDTLNMDWQTVYRPRGPQPKAYLRGQARSVVQHGETVYIAG